MNVDTYRRKEAIRLIGGDEQRSALVSRADQFEQNAGLGLVLGDIGQIVENQQVIFVEFADRSFKAEIAARDLKLLDEVGGPGEQDARQPFSTRTRQSAAARWDFPRARRAVRVVSAVRGGGRRDLTIAPLRLSTGLEPTFPDADETPAADVPAGVFV